MSTERKKGAKINGKSTLVWTAPAIENGTVPVRVVPFPSKRRPRLKNDEVRTREYLTRDEVEQLIKAAGNNRHGHRDKTLILVASRHGLRVREAFELAGIRLISIAPSWLFAGSRKEVRQPIQFRDVSCAG